MKYFGYSPFNKCVTENAISIIPYKILYIKNFQQLLTLDLVFFIAMYSSIRKQEVVSPTRDLNRLTPVSSRSLLNIRLSGGIDVSSFSSFLQKLLKRNENRTALELKSMITLVTLQSSMPMKTFVKF